MKKILSLFLVIVLLISLVGCSREAPEPEGIPFYYCAAETSYSDGDSVITAEYRSSLQGDTLQETLENYLAGPLSRELRSPFPEGMRILAAWQDGSTVYVTVSRELTGLTGLELTIACGCLTLTCLALTDGTQVEISPIEGLLDGQRTITMDENTLLLLDTAAE